MLYIRHLYYIHCQFIDSFRISNNGKLPKTQVALFYIIPCFIGYFLANSKERIPAEILMTGSSIYMGFLIGMLIPFLNFIENQENYLKLIQNPSVDDLEKYTQKEGRLTQYRIMYSQVTYALVISVLSIVFLFSSPPLKAILSNKSFSIYKYTIHYGDFLSNILSTLVYTSQLLNIFVLVIIIISSNVIIYPQLKKMAS